MSDDSEYSPNNNNEEPEYEYGSVPEHLRAFRKILRLTGRDGSVPKDLRGELERKDEYLINKGAWLFEKLVKSSYGKNNSFRIFSLKELQKATNNFSADPIWSHPYPTYRGTIEDRHVAVKIAVRITEVVSLSLIKHRNVVKLLGCCLETMSLILVHELPPNGTLEEYIFPDKHIIRPPVEFLWTDRLRIATEIADALSHLHSELHITHGRLWHAEAVLLDEFHSAKLGAFEYSEIQNQAESSDVETNNGNKFRKLKDVYDFGYILLNLLCIQRDDISRFKTCKEKVKILKYVKLNVSEKEMPQIDAYIDLSLRCRPLSRELRWNTDLSDDQYYYERMKEKARRVKDGEDIFHEKHPSIEFLWTDRLRIATEIADALSYLHSELHMTHGGLNYFDAVLLDEFHSAKLGAFDLSKIQNQAESSDAETNNRNYELRKLKDVHDFGNILLNLLCIQRDDISRFKECKEKVKILKYVKRLNVSEKEMPQIEAYIDLLLRYYREDELSMEEVARELRRIRSM